MFYYVIVFVNQLSLFLKSKKLLNMIAFIFILIIIIVIGFLIMLNLFVIIKNRYKGTERQRK